MQNSAVSNPKVSSVEYENTHRFFIRYNSEDHQIITNKNQKKVLPNPKIINKNNSKIQQIQSLKKPTNSIASTRNNNFSLYRIQRQKQTNKNGSYHNPSHWKELLGNLQDSRFQDSFVKQIKIPIEYYDENRQMDPQYKKKIVYKGYTPPNSCYYIKTLKESSKIKDNFQMWNIKKDQDLIFNSKFESGNLNYVSKISANQYYLYMREDTNTKGLRQWYFFKIINKKIGRYKFRIYKFAKHYSLYQKGMKPFIMTQKENGVTDNWIQKGENIKYNFDFDEKCYYLEFQYLFQTQREHNYMAALPPYTYSQMQKYFGNLATHLLVKKYEMCKSLSGLSIPVIQINTVNYKQQKEFIILIGRTHPGETVSSFVLEGYIETLLNHPFIKQRYIFIIVPMLNVDGVYFGNHRTGILGQDLNRHFNSQQNEYFPQIVGLKKLIKDVKKKGKIKFLFDLHGHSAKRGIFAFLSQQDKHSNKYLYNKIIPVILDNSTDIFSYESCIFKNNLNKKNCARMHFMKNQKIIAITIEASYGLYYDDKLKINQPLGIQNWKYFGVSLAQSLIELNQLIYKQNDPIKILKDYIPPYYLDDSKKKINKIKKSNNFVPIEHKNLFEKSLKIQIDKIEVQMVKQQSKNNININSQIINQYDSQKQSLESDEQEFQKTQEQLQCFKKKIYTSVLTQDIKNSKEKFSLPEKQFILDKLNKYQAINQNLKSSKKKSPKFFGVNFTMNLRYNKQKSLLNHNSSNEELIQLPLITKKMV